MSNKTPEANAAEIESAPKKKLSLWRRPKTYIIVGCIGLLLAPFFLYEQPSRTLRHDGQKISYETVKTPVAREKGLSGRASLPGNRGMLFVFESSGNHCFWMKDTFFALDMIWLDEKKRVITIKEGVQPNTYPKDFCPNKPARYVIEVNAGTAKENHLKPGQKLSLK